MLFGVHIPEEALEDETVRILTERFTKGWRILQISGLLFGTGVCFLSFAGFTAFFISWCIWFCAYMAGLCCLVYHTHRKMYRIKIERGWVSESSARIVRIDTGVSSACLLYTSTVIMLKRFLKYYKPHKRIFFLDMSASFLVSMIGILYPIITRSMLNDFIPDRKYQMIVFFGMALLALYGVRMLLRYFIQYQGHMMGVKMQAQMRRDMFQHLERLPYSFYDAHETGKIMSRMTNDLMDISELAHHGPENLIICSVSIVISFIYLATIDWKLTLIIFACVPILAVVSALLRKRMREAFMLSLIHI